MHIYIYNIYIYILYNIYIYLYVTEGSLEAKLPTIWKDEKGTARKKLGRGESQKGENKGKTLGCDAEIPLGCDAGRFPRL